MKKEFKLSEKILAYKGINEDGEERKEGFIKIEDVKEFIRIVIEEDLEMCKVCGGSHGKWLDKDDFVKRFRKRAGDL